MVREYFELTKPRMVVGNLLVAFAALIFASGTSIDWRLLLFMLVGLGLIIGAACVFNNYFDRHIDAKMARTKNRALVEGRISQNGALLFGLGLLLLGTATLHYHTTPLALAVALLGFSVYVFAYTPLKPHTAFALFVGAVAGAVPPVVGYTAVSSELDVYAVALFGILYLWQIPHFLAISVYRFEEYAAAGVPLYVKNPPTAVNRRRARTVFYASLVVLLILCAGLILQRWMR